MSLVVNSGGFLIEVFCHCERCLVIKFSNENKYIFCKNKELDTIWVENFIFNLYV